MQQKQGMETCQKCHKSCIHPAAHVRQVEQWIVAKYDYSNRRWRTYPNNKWAFCAAPLMDANITDHQDLICWGKEEEKRPNRMPLMQNDVFFLNLFIYTGPLTLFPRQGLNVSIHNERQSSPFRFTFLKIASIRQVITPWHIDYFYPSVRM
jgi:hypothetical protein